MRIAFLLSLIATLLFAGVFWYQSEPHYCQYPISYKLGGIDERFQLSEAEARQAIARAESLWEEAVGEDLFVYDETGGSLVINFVYDERQIRTDEEKLKRDELEELRAENEMKNEAYVRSVVAHKNLQDNYDSMLAVYEKDLAAHNQRVQKYNESGGAPPDVYKELEEARQELEDRADFLIEKVQEINALTEQINILGNEGNSVVEKYNQAVAEYNEKFGHSHEFTQGDYQDKTIKVYTFSNDKELEKVLAHELGHALGIGHVSNPKAVMYHLMGTHIGDISVTDDDVEAFAEVCTTTKWWDII